MGTLFEPEDFVWKLMERDLNAFFKGDIDMEKANVGRALMYGLRDLIPNIRACWAEAREMRAKRERQKEEA
jgi:hypothetical protein